MDILIENISVIDMEEFSEDVDSCDNSDSECGESIGYCVEILVMRVFGGMVVKVFGIFLNFVFDERNFQLLEYGLFFYFLYSNVVQCVEFCFEISVVFFGDEYYFDEISDMEDFNYGEVDGDYVEVFFSFSN